jgi:hypothetical protein
MSLSLRITYNELGMVMQVDPLSRIPVKGADEYSTVKSSPIIMPLTTAFHQYP